MGARPKGEIEFAAVDLSEAQEVKRQGKLTIAQTSSETSQC